MDKRCFGIGILALSLMAGCGGTGDLSGETHTTKAPEKIVTPAGNVSSQSGSTGENAQAEASREFFAMDTYMRVSAYGADGQAEEAAVAAENEVRRLEGLLSTGLATSEIGVINANGGGAVSPDTAYLLERSKELCEMTEGAFDISVYPLMQAWGFPTKEYRVPAEEELAELLKKTDALQVLLDEEEGIVSFGMDGMQIDLGGIAKGYASSRIMEIWRESGITSGLVSLGGNVHALGTKPDGSLWRIAVQSPHDANAYLGILSVQDKAVITSGDYERYFEQDGVRYHHILDPATGYPAESGLVSVTIVSTDGTLADGLSTALFIMGKERTVEFWREHSEAFDVILYTEDGGLYVTEGIAESFSSEQEVQVVMREP